MDHQGQMGEERSIQMTDAMSVVSVDTMHMIALEVGKDMEKVVVVEERGHIQEAIQEAEAGAEEGIGIVLAADLQCVNQGLALVRGQLTLIKAYNQLKLAVLKLPFLMLNIQAIFSHCINPFIELM